MFLRKGKGPEGKRAESDGVVPFTLSSFLLGCGGIGRRAAGEAVEGLRILRL
jgi:hypothetical protein